ncbi:MAG: hypothetical protein RR799_09050, partial [Lachnospiraceae bacterium]
LYDAVNSGVNAIQCGWNGGAFVSSAGNIAWKNKINVSWNQLLEQKIYSKTARKDMETVKYLIRGYGPAMLYALSEGGADGLGIIVQIAKAMKSHCDISQDGYYFNIKGLQGNRSSIKGLEEIKGTRYAIASNAYLKAGLWRYLPKGERTFGTCLSKFGSNLQGSFRMEFQNFAKDAFAIKKGDVFGNIGKAIGYLGIVHDVGRGVSTNLENGAKVNKIITEATIETANGFGKMAVATGCAKVGAAIGAAIPVPVAGTVVGAVAGFALGVVGSVIYDKVVNDDVKKNLSDGIVKITDSIGESIGNSYKELTKGISSIGSAIAAW